MTEQFIGRLNTKGIPEILKEVTTLEIMKEATSKHVLTWVYRIEAHRAQSSALNSIKEAKDFDAIWQKTQSIHMRPCAAIIANIVERGTYPSSALYMEGSVGNVVKTTTLRESADPHRSDR